MYVACKEATVLNCFVMEEGGLSRLDAWRLVNVILRLYKVIANCYDLCNLSFEQELLLPEKWMDKDRQIANYCREPQRYEYGTNVIIELSARTFEKLHEFIIERNDFALALDFVQPKLHLDLLIRAMKKVEECYGWEFASIGFMVSLRDFRAEIYKWAAVHASRINSSIEKEMARRKISSYSLLCEGKNSGSTIREEADGYPIADKNAFDLSDFFVAGYDTRRIARIYQYLKFLNAKTDASYIAQMASVIAVAWENHLLCETYGNTLRAVFDHFGITDKTENYKPSRFRRTSYKGTPPLVRVQALKFFQTLDNYTFNDVSMPFQV